MCRHDHHTPATPDQTLTIAGEALPIHDADIPPQWAERARRKGYDAVCRVKDRYHIALCCHRCGEMVSVKAFTLMNNRPRCPTCLGRKWDAEAQQAGLVFLRRDPRHTQYGLFRAGCGHEVRRQWELIRRIGAGNVGLRCEICHLAIEQAEARAQGWTRLGTDPKNNQNYRLYRHLCGHRQRIARANVQSGRFGCGHCDPGWIAAPSFIYAMRFRLPDGETVVKLGFSRNPVSRLRFQLARSLDQDCALLQQIRIATGRKALSLEKQLHARLRKTFPEAVVAKERFESVINVGSEIYEGWLEPVILRHLDELAAREERARRSGRGRKTD